MGLSDRWKEYRIPLSDNRFYGLHRLTVQLKDLYICGINNNIFILMLQLISALDMYIFDLET